MEEKLKRLREARGLSQVKLAARADLNPATVNQIERGMRDASPGTLRKLADALEVSLFELMEEEAPKKAPSRPSHEAPEDRAGEARRFVELNRWFDYAEVRAAAWEEQAEREQSPFFADWRTAVEWDSEVSKEAFALMQVIDQDLWPFVDGQTLDASQVEQVERITAAVDRLWDASKKVSSQALATVASMASAVRDTAPLSRARRAAEERAEKQRAAAEDIKRRTRELSA